MSRSSESKGFATGRIPLMSDWFGEISGDGCVARRRAVLSPYQLLNGCLGEVQARDTDELWLLCDAQTRLLERIALAEFLRGRP